MAGPLLDVRVKATGDVDPFGTVLKAGEIRRVQTTAINDTARQTTTLAVRLVAKAAGLKVGKTREQFRTYRANVRNMEARIVATGAPVSLVHFSARQTKPGVTARAWGVRKVYPHTFIATVRRGQAAENRAVWVRETFKRLPIRKLYGPGVPGTLAQRAIMEAVEAHAEERLRTNMARQVARALYKKAGQVRA